MNAVLDIGNTRCKYALFEEGAIRETGTDPEVLLQTMRIRKKQGVPLDLLVAGSGALSAEQLALFEAEAALFLLASPGMPLPVRLCYDTPDTLGFDRIASALGGQALYPGRSLLIIDAGTAITIDRLTADGIFLGGNISPGITMRFHALCHFTERLPLIGWEGSFGEVGKTTETAIRGGVLQGVLWEVQGYIRHFLQEMPDGGVLLTGGDAGFLKESLSGQVEFNNMLTLKGLDVVLQFQKRLI